MSNAPSRAVESENKNLNLKYHFDQNNFDSHRKNVMSAGASP